MNLFKKQEKKLIITCIVVAIVMLYVLIKSYFRFMKYYG